MVREEGPFGEWMGYYSDDTVARPYLDIKTMIVSCGQSG